MSEVNPVQELLDAVCQAYQQEHDELIRSARNLETKAQGSVAIAGIFLGGLFAFMRDAMDPAKLSVQALFLGASFLLGTAVVAATVALLVRTPIDILVGPSVEALATDLLQLDPEDLIAERLPGFSGDVAFVWRSRVESLRPRLAHKGEALWIAQILTALGIVGTIAAVLLRLW